MKDEAYYKESYAQEGEDMILARLFAAKATGFYIDIGAHHPKRFSNTYFFYKKGWSGINIDPMPGIMGVFNEVRPRDINIEIGIGNCESELTYYMYNESALNSFDEKIHQDVVSKGIYHLIGTKKIKVSRLETVLDNVQGIQEIDFMNIDAEGLDLDVLRSNNWDKYRPKYVLVECLDSKEAWLEENEVSQFMKSKGYRLFAKTYNTCFFKQ